MKTKKGEMRTRKKEGKYPQKQKQSSSAAGQLTLFEAPESSVSGPGASVIREVDATPGREGNREGGGEPVNKAQKRRRAGEKLIVEVEYAPQPDSDERMRRVVEYLLNSVATAQKSDSDQTDTKSA